MTEWFIKGNKADINKISKEHNISKVLATLLANRGLVNREEIQLFLEPIVENMHKPELMKDMIIAGDIIQDCIASGKKIRIIGDYDVDGISSVYILLTALKRVGALVDYAIPDRIQDGYGINQFQVLQAKAHGIDTIITVDNGISANAQIKMGIDMGMRLVVTDHHDIPYILPEASAIINPKQADCRYPDKRICGAGVALKFAQHILSRFGLERTNPAIPGRVSFAPIPIIAPTTIMTYTVKAIDDTIPGTLYITIINKKIKANAIAPARILLS